MMKAPAPFTVKIADIAIGDRIGFYSEPHAIRLGEAMMLDGQQAPIQVRRNGPAAKLPWTLVAGLHRLRGAQHQGWTEITAIQVADKTAKPAELLRLELAENLSHLTRRPIERAIMMAAVARLEEEIDHPGHVGENPQARALRIRQGTDVTVTDVVTWRERTAAAFDVSLSTLEKHLRLYRAIAVDLSDLAERINAHPLGESFSAMTTLAQIKAVESRAKVANTLLEKDDWSNMQAVLEAAGLAESTGKRPAFTPAAAMDAWNKLKPEGRRTHAVWVADQVDASTAIEMVAIIKRRGLLP